MLNLTLQQLFGSKAVQTQTEIKIAKADLAGLTPLPDNSAEAVLSALLLLGYRNFTGVLTSETGGVVLAGNTPITYDNSQLYEKLNLFLWKRQFFLGKIQDSFVIEIYSAFLP